MTSSRIIETLNKYARKLDNFVGKDLDTRINNFLSSTPPPATPPPATANKDEFTNVPPTPSIPHIIAVTSSELLQTCVQFATFYYITYYVQFTNAHALLQIPAYAFTAATVVFTPFTLAVILLLDSLAFVPLTVAKTVEGTAKTAGLTESLTQGAQTTLIQPAVATLFPSIKFNTQGKAIDTIISTPQFKFLLVRLVVLAIIAEVAVFATQPTPANEPNKK